MSTRPEPYSPYCGLVVNGEEQHEKVMGAPHLAISAPTRTGKTRRILAWRRVMHPGPLVAVSSKEDLAELLGCSTAPIITALAVPGGRVDLEMFRRADLGCGKSRLDDLRETLRTLLDAVDGA
jgi:hypothetical protein